MKNLNQKLTHIYSEQLTNHFVSPSNRRDFFKWLRFYLDFCDNYKHTSRDQKSLQEFMKKVQSKNQSIEQQNKRQEPFRSIIQYLKQEKTRSSRSAVIQVDEVIFTTSNRV